MPQELPLKVWKFQRYKALTLTIHQQVCFCITYWLRFKSHRSLVTVEVDSFLEVLPSSSQLVRQIFSHYLMAADHVVPWTFSGMIQLFKMNTECLAHTWTGITARRSYKQRESRGAEVQWRAWSSPLQSGEETWKQQLQRGQSSVARGSCQLSLGQQSWSRFVAGFHKQGN